MEGKRLGEWLCDLGYARPEQIEDLVRAQADTDPRLALGALMVQRGLIREEEVALALAAQMGAETEDATDQTTDPELRGLIPAQLAQRLKALPLRRENGSIRFAIAGPIDPAERAKLEFLAHGPIKYCVAPESALVQRIQEAYGLSVDNMISDLSQSGGEDGGEHELFVHDLREMAQEPTLINLVNLTITNGIAERASDIHVEPFENELKIKYRIDGSLQEMRPPPKQFQSAIISRIKIMAGLDIAERYIPQDGQIRVNLPDRKVDIRVSTVPTVYGESVVMRLLIKDEKLLDLAELGIEARTLERFEHMLHRPFGINLVCGPTGSGKSTTLYGALKRIYTPAKKIITIEDPVEYQMPGVNQIPVRPKRGLTFAAGLRAILRQDPDIVMVGEVRDKETAEISIRAALTGHLVFSTLHTNDAPSAITRLLDMGIEPFLIASSLQGALGQRLIRRLCPECKRPVHPDPALREQFVIDEMPEWIHEFVGCERCRGRGYLGRVGIYELLTMTEKLNELILSHAGASAIKEAARREMTTMRQDGWEKIKKGQTTPAEVVQATHFDAMG